MPNLMLYPVRSDGAEHRNQLEELQPYLDSTAYDQIVAKSEGTPVRIFGRQRNDRRKWDRLREGDLALFTAAGRAFRLGELLHKEVIEPLARELWPPEEHDGLWDHLLIFGRFRELDLSYHDLNRISGDSPRYVPFGFRIMAADRADRVLRFLGSGPMPA